MKKITFFGLIMLTFMSIWWYSKKLPQPQNQLYDTIKVGVTADYPPFVSLENQEIVGFDIDIVKKAAKYINKKVEFIDMPFNVLILGLQNGKIDMVAAGISADPQKAKQVLFTQPYLTDDPFIILTIPPNNAENISDLKDKEILVNEGYTADLYMSKINGPILKRLPSVTDALLSLKTGHGYAFVTALSVLGPYFEKYGQKQFNINIIKGTNEEYALAISKHQPKLHKQINKAIQKMIQNGTINKLKEKWKIKSYD